MTQFLVAWSALGAAAVILVPLLAPVVLAGAMIVPLALSDHRGLRKQFFKPRVDTAVLLTAAAYMAINASWSLAPDNAVTAVVVMLLATVTLHVGAVAFPLMQPMHLRALSRGFAIGLAVGLVILCFEYATRMSGQRFLERILAEANITSVRIRSGTWEQPLNTGMTRNLGVAVLVVWIGLAALLTWGDPVKRRIISAGLLLLVAVCVLLSPSATAKIGFFAGLATMVAAYYVQRFAVAALTAIWVVLCTAIVPITHILYKLEAYKLGWLHSSGRHRIAIWGATSDWYWNAPIFGSGIASARALEARDPAHAAALQDLGDTAYLNWHAHNGYLQVWFETGVVGAIFMLALGLMTLNAIRHFDRTLKPLLYGAFAAFAFFIATGFSMWAAWYMSAVALVVMSGRLASAEFSSRGAAGP
jgi:hypothetical protein